MSRKVLHYKKTIWISFISFLIMFCLFIVLFNSSIFYPSNHNFDRQTNNEIKKLVINSLKDLFSPFGINNTNLYYEIDENKIIQCDSDSNIKKSILFIVDRNFMKDIYMSENNTFVGIVKIYFPKEYFCHIEIIYSNNEYKISKFQLDV